MLPNMLASSCDLPKWPYASKCECILFVPLRGKLHIVKQIQEQLDQRMLQDEMRAQEGEQILKDLEKLQLEELQVQVMESPWLSPYISIMYKNVIFYI